MTDIDDNSDDIDIFSPDNDCCYYDVPDIKNCFNSRLGLYVLNLNIRSVRKNLDELMTTLDTYKVHFPIIILTETWLNDASEWTPVPGYDVFHSVRHNRTGGGVSILVDTNFKASSLPDLTINNDDIECCVATFNLDDEHYTIMGVYRAPNVNVNNFNTQLSDLISDNVLFSRYKCIIAGDLNIDIGKDCLNSAENELLCLLKSLSFLPAISLPTRVTDSSATIVDHIWSNVTQFESGVVRSDTTDHYMCFIGLPTALANNIKIKKQFRDHNNDNLTKFCDQIRNFVSSFNANFSNLNFELRCEIF